MARRAYGAHRKMSQQDIVRNIVESILAHRENGVEKRASDYTPNAETQALVEKALNAQA